MTTMMHLLVVLMIICVSSAAQQTLAQEKQEQQEQPAEIAANEAGTGEIILVIGAAGADEYREPFAGAAEKWLDVAKQSETPIKTVGREGEGKLNDREQLQAAIKSAASESTAPLWLVMIGHGTFTRGVAKFNLRGPDVSATELAQWLESHQRPVVVVNCASASGPFVNRLSGKNRIVVTATKSGTEHSYARFGEYFARAIAAPDSDLDHDDEVSVHEAFLRASADVRQFYANEARIISEHALIDDNGDGRGTPASMFRGVRADAVAKDGAQLDGPVASRVTLAPAGGRLPFTAEELKQRATIEKALDELRSRKLIMSEVEYDTALEPLMLRLAKIYQAAEQRAAKK